MNNQRNTVQRAIILDKIRNMRAHPTIEDVHDEVSKSYPTISKTTVYRNLRLLAQNGMITRISLLDGLERYDADTHHHYHFQCSGCGGVFDVNIPHLPNIDVATESVDFYIHGHELAFYGLCKLCHNLPSIG
ncbi:MAG: transcriptional repressor [Defluviitaleaceae bacterium]|nr:transcriptional repressor [Defluviitaleaceae bacterium]